MSATILIPVDIAQIGKAKAMIEIAKSQPGDDNKLILLNIVEEIPNWVASTLPADILGKSQNMAIEKLQEAARAGNIDPVIEVRSGHASQTILRVAKEVDASLIIVASHNPDLSDYFLGSTAANVVRHAHCSVYVLR